MEEDDTQVPPPADIRTVMARIRETAQPEASSTEAVEELIRRWREKCQKRIEALTVQAAEANLEQARLESRLHRVHQDVSRARELRNSLAEPVARLLEASPVEGVLEGAGQEHLRLATEVAPVGREVPEFKYYGQFRRYLARLVGRVVRFLVGPITAHQRLFNGSVLSLLSSLLHRQEQTGLEVETLCHQVAAMQLGTLRHRVEIVDLEDRLQDMVGRAVRAEGIAVNLKREVGEEIRNLRTRLRQFRSEQVLQEGRLNVLLEEARRRLPDSFDQEQVSTFISEHDHFFDSQYKVFEDIFRGSEGDIRNRLTVYLPFLRALSTNLREAPVLDLGCGRGEWLELLRDEGFGPVVGVDRNQSMVERCCSRGLEVVEADALEALRSRPDRSLGVVTAFHLLEHLPFERVVELLDEIHRVLKPGGMIIAETPNPENVIVGGSTFHTDPTHRSPLHPQVLRFVVEQRGFVDVEILRPVENRPYPLPPPLLDEREALADQLNPYLELLRQHFFVPWDFAVLGRRVSN